MRTRSPTCRCLSKKRWLLPRKSKGSPELRLAYPICRRRPPKTKEWTPQIKATNKNPNRKKKQCQEDKKENRREAVQV